MKGDRVSRLAAVGHGLAGDRPARPEGEWDVRDVLDQLSASVSRLTDTVERFRGNALNHVLFSGTGRIPASGEAWTTQSEVPWAQVIILPIVNDLRVEAAPASNAAAGPRTGPGVWWCPVAAGRLVIPMVGTVLSIYGTPNAYFDLALLTVPLTGPEGR